MPHQLPMGRFWRKEVPQNVWLFRVLHFLDVDRYSLMWLQFNPIRVVRPTIESNQHLRFDFLTRGVLQMQHWGRAVIQAPWINTVYHFVHSVRVFDGHLEGVVAGLIDANKLPNKTPGRGLVVNIDARFFECGSAEFDSLHVAG